MTGLEEPEVREAGATAEDPEVAPRGKSFNLGLLDPEEGPPVEDGAESLPPESDLCPKDTVLSVGLSDGGMLVVGVPPEEEEEDEAEREGG